MSTAPAIDSAIRAAISGAVGPTPEPELDLSELDALALDDEPFDDPLGIAMAWEEKYGKEKKAKKKAKMKKEKKEKSAGCAQQ